MDLSQPVHYNDNGKVTVISRYKREQKPFHSHFVVHFLDTDFHSAWPEIRIWCLDDDPVLKKRRKKKTCIFTVCLKFSAFYHLFIFLIFYSLWNAERITAPAHNAIICTDKTSVTGNLTSWMSVHSNSGCEFNIYNLKSEITQSIFFCIIISERNAYHMGAYLAELDKKIITLVLLH